MIKKSYRYIGVDLAVDKLDIHAEGKDLHYPNNETGIRKLASVKSERPVLLEVFTDAAKDIEVYSKYYRQLKLEL